MKNSIMARLRGRSVREIYLYIEEKIVKSHRKRLYNKAIFTSQPSRSYVLVPYFSEKKIFDLDLLFAESYCCHIFDMLGSGPQKLDSKNAAKVDLIQQISSFDILKIIWEIEKLNPEYKSIEWQLDFKNWHLFDVLQKSEFIQNSESNGFDIKLPWELARCQHLPFLARLYRKTGENRYKDEILCEILDFIAFNPIGYGVNWKCTMDVAIRVSNWIMALDLVQESLNETVDNIISKAIYQHCVYIRYHLEDQRKFRGNHYLADIIGLLYSSTYFSAEGEMKRIQEFSIKQLFSSIDEQFYEDGGNFESSLSYHRFSIELVIYGLWRILLLSEHNDLCRQYTENMQIYKKIIEKAGSAFKMMFDATKPSGDIYQLGDNDSGHLFRFYHFGEMVPYEQYTQRCNQETKVKDDIWNENELSCKEIISIINAIIRKNCKNLIFDELIGNVFKTSGIVPILIGAYDKAGNGKRIDEKNIDLSKFPYIHTEKIEFEGQVDLTNITPFCYLNFGLAGLKNNSLYLGISITDVGQNGRGGHSHNDKLSYELYAEGIDYQCDPGTYVYTESLKWRNKFRSSLAHNSPYFGEEQNIIGENCFELKQRTKCELMELTNRVIQASCRYGDIYVIRRFELSERKLIIKDYSNEKFIEHPEFSYYSNGYGKKQLNKGGRKL